MTRLMSIAFAVYGAGVSVVVWMALVPWALIAAARRREAWDDLMERLGQRTPKPSSRRVLVHAVSVGEMTAAMALVDALAAELPGCAVVLTTGTTEGKRPAERLRATRAAVEACVYLPWDRPKAIRRWQGRVEPAAVVVVETELWPNLFRACRDLAIPLLVVSGRVYPREVRRYALAAPFFRDVFGGARWIGVQTDRERDAFLRIGAPPERTRVAGNLKFDAVVTRPELPVAWARALDGHGPVVVAGSTHAPEEQWLTEACVRLRDRFPRLRLALAAIATIVGSYYATFPCCLDAGRLYLNGSYGLPTNRAEVRRLIEASPVLHTPALAPAAVGAFLLSLALWFIAWQWAARCAATPLESQGDRA